jgi:hypothetical protein
MKLLTLGCLILSAGFASQAYATLADYDAGTRTVLGVQLVQDANDSSAYYYLPQFPRVAREESGDFNLLLLRQNGTTPADSGGIFHALVEFSLPEETLQQVAAKLAHDVPGAVLRGPMTLLPMEQDGASSFTVVSGTLQPGTSGDRIEGTVLTSGQAPLNAGSRAVISARLTANQADLLWNTLARSSVISDVSVSIRAYYEAKVKGYNAIISADANTIYNHQSLVTNTAEGYSHKEIRKIADQLITDHTIKIEVFDRTSTEIKADDMAKLTDVVTDKLIELIFDNKTGWSKVPDQEVAVAAGQVLGRQERGFFSKVFGGSEDTPYYTDDQYVKKKIENVRSNKMYINLSKSTVIRVPFNSSGNLGGVYDAVPADQRGRYFKTISASPDADRQRQDLFVQIDGTFIDSFGSVFNNVNFTGRQKRGDQYYPFSFVFRPDTVKAGHGIATQSLERLGDPTDDWRNIEYQLSWSVLGVPQPIRQPADQTLWQQSHDPAITLVPPIERHDMSVEAITSEFGPVGVRACEVQVWGLFAGTRKKLASKLVRATDAGGIAGFSVYSDVNKPLAAVIYWSSMHGHATQGPFQQDGDIITVLTPTEDWLRENSRP